MPLHLGAGRRLLLRVLDGDGPRKEARQRQAETFQKGYYNHTFIYLNATTRAVTTTFARASGKSTFQPNCMIWSYRSRGKVALSQMKKNTTTHTLMKNQRGRGREAGKGPSQPPRKSVVGDGRDGHHVGILRHEEKGEFHAAVLDIEAAGQLALRLGHVEGRPVDLREARHEVKEEGERLIDDEPHVALGLDDVREPKRAREDDRAYDDEAQGDLVADHLRRGPQGAEDAVLVARGPAAEDDAVFTEGRKGEHEEEADIDIPDHQLDGPAEKMDRAAEGDDREHAKDRKKGDHGRHDEEGLVRVGRDDAPLS